MLGTNTTLVFGTQSFILVATQQSSAEYDWQTESYNIMVSCNTIDVSVIFYTWKACICFGFGILISVPFSCSVNYLLCR